MELKDAYYILLNDPRTLLDNCFLALAGGGPESISGLTWFTISKPDELQNYYVKAGQNGYVPTFEIRLCDDVPQQTNFKSGGVEYYAFEAWYVAMKRQANQGYVPSGTLCRLPSNSGPDLCITSQLSGCIFGIGNQVNGGCCTVTHMLPDGTLDIERPEMVNQTEFLHGGNISMLVERHNGSYVDRANVIGKRMWGRWFFHIQEFTGGYIRQIQGVRDLN